jgi:hypothetical protein
MLTDVVDQLRNAARPSSWSSRLAWALVPCRLLHDAALEIERLRFTRDAVLRSIDLLRSNRMELLAERDAEIAKLRSTIEVLRVNIDRAQRR